MRKKIHEIIEVSNGNNKLSAAYDFAMMFTIFISIIPLAFVDSYPVFDIIEKITVTIFIIDYLLRWITADYKLRKGKKSFVLYPFTPLAIIDIFSILPSVTVLNNGFKLFKLFRLFRTLKVLKVFKAVRYSKNIRLFLTVFRKQKDVLLTIFGIALAYILVSALIILNVEPQTFGSYFRAIYWATVSLTTMGYGDIYPVTEAGQIVTMLSSLVGIAVVALPAGVITAGLMDELNEEKNEKEP